MEPLDFVKRMLDFNRLMDGENRENYHADDIMLWRAVYADMIQFNYDEYTLGGSTISSARAFIVGLSLSAIF